MDLRILTMIVVELGLSPAVCLAQAASGPCTRAEVLQHLYDLESEGFWPTQASNLRFPLNIEAAEARLAARQAAQTQESGDSPAQSPANPTHCFR
ncbi:hypothetical protein M3I54_20255 [Paraburkholderia sp. CNPSo 3274]|uniref:hypothetical protein n=1 Tax=Paraburkholderia sp. CNPSo 3274 TaxID=2940932 RepID=UPI0020B7972B|nr:hypothetical protein [Paraburkholderia sp. CNPSo 3274]MCP3709298.1 hypothetical protein [Paraburkholderia sp. CNPSo 3274]